MQHCHPNLLWIAFIYITVNNMYDPLKKVLFSEGPVVGILNIKVLVPFTMFGFCGKNFITGYLQPVFGLYLQIAFMQELNVLRACLLDHVDMC